MKKTQEGFSLIELMIVLAIITILSGASLFYFSGHQKLYKPDEQSLKIVDILQEARQRSLTQRRTMRVEVNFTAKKIRLINENTSSTSADDAVLKQILLLPNNDVRIKAPPTNITYNPPETLPVPGALFKPSIYPGSTGEDVCTIRFLSNGSVVDGGNNVIGTGAAPTGVTLHVWSPKDGGSNESSIARAITIVGASGSIRLWEFDATSTAANKWQDSRRSGAYAN